MPSLQPALFCKNFFIIFVCQYERQRNKRLFSMPKRTYYHICLPILLLLASCTVSNEQGMSLFHSSDIEMTEDISAKQTLQGIWIDYETGNVSFFAKGDTIYYPDTANTPVLFFLYNDTLFLASTDTSTYIVKELCNNKFAILSATEDTIYFTRSINPDDTLFFVHRQAAPLTFREVSKNDSVIYHNGARYHCYVYVNPSTLKVYKTSYTDEGIAVKNIYYDNVIHICVYQGRTCLFGRDYNKSAFSGLVPESFLAHAVLSNMEIGPASNDGCHFFATISIPDDVACYVIDILAGYDGNETLKLVDGLSK